MLTVPHHWNISGINSPTELLHQVFKHKKHINPHFSLRSFARQLCCSPSSLSDALLEKSLVSTQLALNLAYLLKLRKGETDFLLALTQGILQKNDKLRAYYLNLSQRIKKTENLVKDGELRRIAKTAQLEKLSNYYNQYTNTYRQLRIYRISGSRLLYNQLYVDCTYSQKGRNTAFIFETEKELFIGGHSLSNLEARVDKINPNLGSKDLHLNINQFGFPVIKNLALTPLGETSFLPFNLEFSLVDARVIHVKTNVIADRYRYMENSTSSPFPFCSILDNSPVRSH